MIMKSEMGILTYLSLKKIFDSSERHFIYINLYIYFFALSKKKTEIPRIVNNLIFNRFWESFSTIPL